jgi:hypothetical protein
MVVRALALPICAAVVVATLQAATVTRQQSDSFARKLGLITRHADISPRPAKGQRTQVSEGELNSWFAFRSQRYLPAGVAPPTITIVGNGKLLGNVTLDLSSYAQSRKSGGALDPWNLLMGKVPVGVTGILHSKDGRGRCELQGADVSGIPLPKSLLQELVSYYSRTPDKPQGIRLDDPFELPANIRTIEVGQGQAVVVQ